MNTYDAIMAAAEHIEKNPDGYNFSNGYVPRGDFYERNKLAMDALGGIVSAGYPCCMLARIGAYLDASYAEFSFVARYGLGVEVDIFYKRICEITSEQTGIPFTVRYLGLDNTRTIPAAMRAYAQRYHGIPKSVKQIFTCGTVEKALENA